MSKSVKQLIRAPNLFKARLNPVNPAFTFSVAGIACYGQIKELFLLPFPTRLYWGSLLPFLHLRLKAGLLLDQERGADLWKELVRREVTLILPPLSHCAIPTGRSFLGRTHSRGSSVPWVLLWTQHHSIKSFFRCEHRNCYNEPFLSFMLRVWMLKSL